MFCHHSILYFISSQPNHPVSYGLTRWPTWPTEKLFIWSGYLDWPYPYKEYLLVISFCWRIKGMKGSWVQEQFELFTIGMLKESWNVSCYYASVIWFIIGLQCLLLAIYDIIASYVQNILGNQTTKKKIR